jgi:hypothetical protein
MSPVLSLPRDILAGRVDCASLVLMLHLEEISHSRWRDAGLVTFFHGPNYGRFEPVNNALINFSKYIVTGLVFVASFVAICSEIG